MRVLIHALGAEMGGAARHLRAFVPALDRLTTADEFVVVARHGMELRGGNRVTVHRVEPQHYASVARRLAFDLRTINAIATRSGADAIVSLTNFGPITTPVPHVMFQRNALYYSPWATRQASWPTNVAIAARRRLAFETMRRARLVVTPSEAMAAMIRRTYDLPVTLFRTLHHACDIEGMSQPLAPEAAAALDRPGVKLLYPTHPAPHKGFDILFAMLASIARHRIDWTLVLPIEPGDWPAGVLRYQQQIERLGLRDRVVLLGRVPASQMGTLYRACDLMVYPSLVESFGFPLVEGMACGLPIVAADTPVNREVCGDGAAFYRATDASHGAAVLMRHFDEQYRAPLARAARLRAMTFPGGWDQYARRFVDVVTSVC